jgi:hypothetical protein
MILVVVDRFTKYAHFIAMKHPITVKIVAKAFIENIFKLHGLPSGNSDSNSDRTDNLYKSLVARPIQSSWHQTTHEHFLSPPN